MHTLKMMRNLLLVARFIATVPIRLYRLVISPVLPPSCIYTPSCSHYALDSVMRHGILRGTLLAVGRVTRCVGAFFDGGPDPVPDEFSAQQILANYRRFRHRREKRID